jgi:hypothetical protein
MPETERRLSQRRPYICQQLVADYDGAAIPEKGDFYQVTFQNLSDTGASFLSSRKPATSKLVIILGTGKILVTARVVKGAYRADSPEMPYEVGCEFERRLS